ncbi:MAG: nucleoside hydrolase [Candidatus Melainabacteria bacterium]|nr:nucleoside hydrolase [Candidatus Melainabacteria bacterium]
MKPNTSADPFRSLVESALEKLLHSLSRRLLIVGDFGKDLDDEDTVLFLTGEQRHRRQTQLEFFSTPGSRKQDLFELKAVIANLAPPIKRAQLAKGTLKLLGQPNVPVGIGTDCKNSPNGHDHEFAKVTYMADVEELEDGRELLIRTLEGAEDNSITLVLISGMTDIAVILREHADLFKAKVESVAIMGGVEVEKETNKVVIDQDGYMIPDSAANNKFDMDSAIFTYRRIQELGIKMVILTRAAAYACKVPRSFYDELAATGHPVGIKLRNSQQGSIESLWQRACLPADDEGRAKLPNRCDKDWFCNTFCGGKGKDRTGIDSIWDLIQSFNLYDPMTLIAAVPELRERFYDPTVVKVGETEHLVIGVCDAVSGVKDAEALAQYMLKRCLLSLTCSLEELPAEFRAEKADSEQSEPPCPPPKGASGDITGDEKKA